MQYHDARLINQWDHTAQVCQSLYTLTTTVINLGGGKARTRSIDQFHPYRKKEKTGLKITKSNFKFLKQIGDAVVSGKKR